MSRLWRYTTTFTLSILSLVVSAEENQTFNREDYIIFKELNVDWGGEVQTQESEVSPHYDLYNELLQYTNLPIEINRRGVSSWLLYRVLDSEFVTVEPLPEIANSSKVRVAGSMEGYNLGLRGDYSTNINKSSAITSSIDYRTGRDLFVDGVFSNQFRAEIGWNYKFNDDDYLSVSLYIPYINASQRNGVNDEIVSLTSDPLYNSAWGYYDGEVRSSKIDTYAVPRLDVRYQRKLSSSTTLAAQVMAKYGVSSRSQLGWYDGYNPYPDYYRNLPSYIQNESSHTTIERAWQSGDSDYTQINWDQLVWSNQISADGESCYVMESRVRRIADIKLDLMASSILTSQFTICYGIRGEYNSTRNYKQLDDLLGGDYLLNTDQYIGDYENLDLDMDNDLQNPNRKVECGDRFGYDYTLSTLDYSLILGVNYTHERLSVELRGELGSRKVQRVGHYEKERFAASLSYGASSTIELPQNSLNYSVDYQLNNRSKFTLSGAMAQLAPLSYDLFIQPEYANLTVANGCSSTSGAIASRYEFHRVGLHFTAEAFFNWSNNFTDVVRYYDDLDYIYTNAVVSEIDTRGVGIEAALSVQLNKILRLENTLCIGRYRYSDAPLVSLYDDSDLTLYSQSRASAIEGCAVSQSASLYSTTAIDLLLNRGWILSAQLAITTGRYVDPSFVRRTDRVVSSLLSSGLSDDAIGQEKLSDMYDLSLSVMRTIYLAKGSLTLFLRLDNALGDDYLEQSGRESNRALYYSGGSTTGSRYLQPNSYTYAIPRRIYISCTYNF